MLLGSVSLTQLPELQRRAEEYRYKGPPIHGTLLDYCVGLHSVLLQQQAQIDQLKQEINRLKRS